MNAKKFLHKKDVAYMNRLSTSLDFDRIVSLMEEYAALCIYDIVGLREHFKCEKCGSDWGEVRATCFNCNHVSEDLSS